jgi:hypothetical protein
VSLFALRRDLGRVARALPFRVAVACAFLAFHLSTVAHLARERFGYPFNASPRSAPAFTNPAAESTPRSWDRLVVSRWDSQHYIALGLRGLDACKNRSQLAPGQSPYDSLACEVNFFPTYGWMGRWLVAVLHVPVDYAMLGLSLVASFLLMVMWTGEAVVEGLGVGGAYLSLLLMNVFPWGFSLVTILTEPCMLALTFGAFVCLRKRWLLLGALLAGAASAIRVTSVGAGFAYAAGLLVLTLRENPRPRTVWARRAALMALSGWGIIALMTYYGVRFGDPLAYAHAHGASYHHKPGLARVFFPDGRLLLQSIWSDNNDGVVLGAGLLWFALGHRQGLARFTPEGQAFFYVLFFSIVGVAMIGSADLAYNGCSRYIWAAIPLFFAIAGVTRKKPVVLALWLLMSCVHYYNGGMCWYLGQNDPQRLQKCNFARYYRSEDLEREQGR